MSAPDTPFAVRIAGASKSFAQPDGTRFAALRDITLDVRQGEIFGLVGRSGAGKSTLLRLFNLLERPDSGSVTVAGRELTRLHTRELRQARRHIGMVFQGFNLLQNATVFDNVAFPLRLSGQFNAPHLQERVAECLALAGLEDKARSYPAQLSGGQKQRVAIARALSSHPDVLLCDEPTSALDPETTRGLLATLRDVNRRLGVTIVIVSHELQVIGALCDRVAVLEDGAVAEQFALNDHSVVRSTALGRELAWYDTEARAAATLGAAHA